MPMKSNAGGCGCCGSSPCTTCSPVLVNSTHDSTQTVEGSTHYRYDLPSVSSSNVFLTSYQVKYVVVEISNGDWYRVNYADVPLFGASSTTAIEKSTDNGATWIVQKSVYTDGTDSLVYEEESRCGVESPSLASTHVSSKAITNEQNACFYGENSSGCYFGLSNLRTFYTEPDADFMKVGDRNSLWDSSTGRGVFSSEVNIVVASETITAAYLLHTSSGSKNRKYIEIGTYTGFNCATDSDPNCGCVCPASFPGISLNVDSMSFTVAGGVSKTVTIDGSYSASGGYCELESLDGNGISEFGSANALARISDYVTDSQPEYSSVGAAREWCGNNNGYYDIRGFGRDSEMCHASAFAYVQEECKILDGWYAEAQGELSTDPTRYTPQSGPAVGATLLYSWTANAGGTDLTALSSSVSPTYNGGYYQSSDMRDVRAAMDLTVAAETDCTVTLQLVVTDFKLQHGVTSEINAGTPIWEKTAVVNAGAFSKPEYEFDVNNHWNPPNMDGVRYGEIRTIIEPSTAGHGGSSPWYENHTNEYAFHVDNGAATGESQALSFRAENNSANWFTTSETGTRLDPEWTPWTVTFEKTVSKSSLASSSVTVNFSSSDITSTNHTVSRSTFAPFDNSAGYTIANQYNSLAIVSASGSRYHSVVTVLKPAGYSTPTVAVADSDWSASVTLKRSPFYN